MDLKLCLLLVLASALFGNCLARRRRGRDRNCNCDDRNFGASSLDQQEISICGQENLDFSKTRVTKILDEIVLQSGRELRIVNPNFRPWSKPIFRCEVTIRHADKGSRLRAKLETRLGRSCSPRSATFKLFGLEENISYNCGRKRRNVFSKNDSLTVVFEMGDRASHREEFSLIVNAA